MRTTAPASKRLDKEKMFNLVYVVPALLIFLVFSVFPIYRTIQYSFTNSNGVTFNHNYIGFDNYVQALTDKIWWHGVGNGLFFAVTALIFMNSIALLLALSVNTGIRGNKAYRVIFYIPPILSGIVVGYLWKWIYDPDGLINLVLNAVGLKEWTHAWIAETGTALISISIASMWQGVGGSFILFLAGLQGIPAQLYEAAKIDGANRFQQLIYITIPSLRRVYTLVNILTILGAMQIFNHVYSMTNGGPGYATEVPALRIYREAFRNGDFGMASTFSVLFALMLFVVSIIQLKYSQKDD
ncbi:MAG: sugar ABC transporter permease [Bacilli bacterium]